MDLDTPTGSVVSAGKSTPKIEVVWHNPDTHNFCSKCDMCVDCGDCAIYGCGHEHCYESQ